jgi:DNA-binding beta-propeller fold protein YncE
VLISVNAGFLPHSIDVFDIRQQKFTQHIRLTSAYNGLAWSADGHSLYVAGGNASGKASKSDPIAPIYEFSYADGRLIEQPAARLVETIDPKEVWWSGIAYLPSKNILYAANRGTGTGLGTIVAFNTKSREIVTRIPVETTPYQLVLSADGRYLFVSNWSSESVCRP